MLLAVALNAGCIGLKRFAYEGFNRDKWQHPEEVIQSLEIAPAEKIADIGSGAGYFTFRLARAVGATGKVYAVDVDRGLNDYVAQRAREEGLINIETVQAEYADPRIPEPVDLIFTSNTYHHIQNRAAYFANARRYLRPQGRVAIVELKGTGWFERWFGHSTTSDVIRSEMESAGYRLDRELTFLPRQHFLIFSVPPQ